MSKHDKADEHDPMSKDAYKTALHALQIELVKLQRHFIGCDDKILILLEGRDAAGKDGVIKRIVKHLSPRETRVVALGKPSDRDTHAWYFQRYVPHLPVAGEFVLFNRSWYNRAGVERVMGFCTDDEYEEFMETVQSFEHMLVRWTVVRADDKRAARLAVIKDLLSRLHYRHKDESVLFPDPEVALRFDVAYLENGMVAP